MKSLEELKSIRDKVKHNMDIRKDDHKGYNIAVGMGTCGINAGARDVLLALVEAVQTEHMQHIIVTQDGHSNEKGLEPVIYVYEPSGEKVTYVNMDKEKALHVLREHVLNGNVVSEYTMQN